MIDSTLIQNAGYINGEWISEGSLGDFDVINPANQEVITTLPNMGTVETEKAILAASGIEEYLEEKYSVETHF